MVDGVNNQKIQISPSILSLKLEEVASKITKLEEYIEYIHIDVMDGKFVQADTTRKMMEYTECIKHVSQIPIDVHLMVNDVEDFYMSYCSKFEEYF